MRARLVLLVAVMLGGAGAYAQCPAAPTGLTPADQTANVSTTPTLTWNAASGATSYDVYFGTLGNGCTASPVATVTGTSHTLPGALANGTIYEWKVVAKSSTCPAGTATSCMRFKTVDAACTPAGAFSLSVPVNQSTISTQTPILNWTASSGAAQYVVHLSQNNPPTGIGSFETFVTAPNTSYPLTSPLAAGTYYWQVVAVPSCGAGGATSSAVSSFTVHPAVTCGTSIALAAPQNNATVNSPVAFSWNAVSGATSYRLWVSIDGSSAVPLARVTTTSTSLQLPSGNADVYVEALFESCPPVASPHVKFAIAHAANCDTHKAVTLTAPINNATATSPVDFSWTATDASATLYRVFVSINGEPFGDVGITKDTHLRHDVPSGTVAWYVESFFEGCASVRSSTATFTIPRAGCPTAVPILISPENNGLAQSPVTLTWTAVSGAVQYRVFGAIANFEPQLIGVTSDTSLTRTLIPGSYGWLVEAVFDRCPSTRSAKSIFTIPLSQNCTLPKAQLVAPANGATVTSPVRLAWNPVSGAVGYALWARFNDGPPTRVTDTTRTEGTFDLGDGTYEWWIESFFAGCPSSESDHFTFVIPAPSCDNRRPILFHPLDRAAGLVSPVELSWSAVPKAKSYNVYIGTGDDTPSLVSSGTATSYLATLPTGIVRWYVEAVFDNCPNTRSAASLFTVRSAPTTCGTPAQPLTFAPGQVVSGTSYNVRWTAVPGSTRYEIQESTTRDFASPTTSVGQTLSASFSHVVNILTKYYYRVRAISDCSDDKGPYSLIEVVAILPPAARNASVEVGVTSAVQQTVFVPGVNPPVTFTATTDKPWATVSPSSGTLGPAGVTLTLTSDPAALKLGTNTATIKLAYTAAGKSAQQASGSPSSVPVSITMATPVSSDGKSAPPPDSLIIPAVGHAAGANDSLFESDVRLANTSSLTQRYQLNFTLSGTDGTQSGQTTNIEVLPGATMALDDILSTFFGAGLDGTSATGVLEIRPTTSTTSSLTSTTPSVSLATVASSRTYNQTPTGTFGQFIPAIPFSQFISRAADGAAKTLISLQQIAQSAAYRTNFGLVEASGQPADLLIHVFDKSGAELGTFPQSLLAGEHLQLNNFLGLKGLTLDEGRLEVEVTSATGKVTAYASVVDNLTNDPLLVFPVVKNQTTATRYVLPGVGDFDIGFAHWKSDIRIFNPSSNDTQVTLGYYPQGDPTHPATFTTTVKAGEERAIDNAIETLFGLHATAGSAIITTSSPSSLITTARTYTQLTTGTYGQFIPGVTPDKAVGTGSRLLQLLQLEQSSRFRTNIGLAETTGNAATVDVQMILPDSKSAPKVTLSLKANEFLQFSLASFGVAGDIYNARVTIKVTSGSGKVTAYGSVIDQTTQDPTYVIAQ